jgi:hypothetical protein
MEMKKIVLAILAISGVCFGLRAQQLTYSLPQTVIVVEVDAVRTVTYAGPYAAYAKDLLGINVPQKDEYKTVIKEIRTEIKVEADLSQRHLTAPAKASDDLLAMSSLGLVAFGSKAEADAASWTFTPAFPDASFAGKGLTQPYTTEKRVVYQEVQTDSALVRIPVQKDVTVEKTVEQKAREAAAMVLRARDEKFKITIGDTDATYSGEALGSAIAELTRVEEEYLTLFTGYSVSSEMSRRFEGIPVKGTDSYDVFRLSDSEGILPAEAKAGKPYYMDVIPATVGAPAEADHGQTGTGTMPYYRVPAVCNVTLGVGTTPLVKMRVPVYQMGEEQVNFVK